MVQRRKMDPNYHSWGQDKGSDRERAKAIRDHAGSGSTAQLVEVEMEVEVTAATITRDHTQAVVDHLSPFGGPDNLDSYAAVYNLLKQRGDL